MTSPSNLHYWLAALHLYDIGPSTVFSWLERFRTLEELFNASDEAKRIVGLSPNHIHLLANPNWTAVEQDLAWLQQSSNHAIIAFDSDQYPPLLKTLSNPPILLFVKGNPASLISPQLAIVGARNATAAAISHAEQFAYCLATHHMTITSGLALGIDAASHRGALRAKGQTIAVMATGIDQIYPPSHRRLAADIVDQGGAIISEFPLSTLPKAPHFPRRNRLISGLSRGVLVVEAAIKSGSLITAHHALEQGREVFAIPGSINNPLTRGCHHLIRQGAKLVETANDILEEFSLTTPLTSRASSSSSQQAVIPSKAKDLEINSRAYQHLLNTIDYDVTPTDMIIFRSRLTAGEVSSMLLILELNGYIRSVSGGYIRIAA